MATDTGTRLTNASVIRRVWENQAEFQADVLSTVALAGDAGGDRGRRHRTGPRPGGGRPEHPGGAPRRPDPACRVGGEASLRALAGSRNWSLWVGVWVLAVTGPTSGRSRRIRQALLDGYGSTTEAWAGMHGALADHLGFRLREPFTLRQFTVSVGALVEGCALREGAEPGAGRHRASDRPRGCTRALDPLRDRPRGPVPAVFEIDPDWRPAGAGG